MKCHPVDTSLAGTDGGSALTTGRGRHQSMLQSELPDPEQSGQCHSRPLPGRAHPYTHIQTLTPSHIDFRSILGAAKHQTLQFVIQ